MQKKNENWYEASKNVLNEILKYLNKLEDNKGKEDSQKSGENEEQCKTIKLGIDEDGT